MGKKKRYLYNLEKFGKKLKSKFEVLLQEEPSISVVKEATAPVEPIVKPAPVVNKIRIPDLVIDAYGDAEPLVKSALVVSKESELKSKVAIKQKAAPKPRPKRPSVRSKQRPASNSKKKVRSSKPRRKVAATKKAD